VIELLLIVIDVWQSRLKQNIKSCHGHREDKDKASFLWGGNIHSLDRNEDCFAQCEYKLVVPLQ